MRVVLVVVLALVAGCGGSSSDDPGAAGPAYGAVPLAGLCPQVHRAIDTLVVSNPGAQQQFVAELERIAAAGTRESRTALDPLLAAARALAAAGTGPDYATALNGIHPAQVAVDGACAGAGSPILHDGPH